LFVDCSVSCNRSGSMFEFGGVRHFDSTTWSPWDATVHITGQVICQTIAILHLSKIWTNFSQKSDRLLTDRVVSVLQISCVAISKRSVLNRHLVMHSIYWVIHIFQVFLSLMVCSHFSFVHFITLQFFLSKGIYLG
jgi:small-conductance mechanosensitive channel